MFEQFRNCESNARQQRGNEIRYHLNLEASRNHTQSVNILARISKGFWVQTCTVHRWHRQTSWQHSARHLSVTTALLMNRCWRCKYPAAEKDGTMFFLGYLVARDMVRLYSRNPDVCEPNKLLCRANRISQRLVINVRGVWETETECVKGGDGVCERDEVLVSELKGREREIRFELSRFV